MGGFACLLGAIRYFEEWKFEMSVCCCPCKDVNEDQSTRQFCVPFCSSVCQ